MELPDRSRASESRTPAPLPKGGKLERIAGHTQGLVEDLREWIDLRIDLAVLEVEEKVDTLQNNVALGVTLAILAFFCGLFGLTTIAIGLGWALGHSFWGFLAVFVALALLLVIFQRVRPELVPPSNLFKQVRPERSERGDAEATERPAREAQATVSDASPSDASGSGTSSAARASGSSGSASRSTSA